MLPCCSLAPLTVGPVALMVNAPGHPATSQQVARPTATRSAELRTEGQTVGVRSRSPGAPEPRPRVSAQSWGGRGPGRRESF